MQTRRPRVFAVVGTEELQVACQAELSTHGVNGLVSQRLTDLRDFHREMPVDLMLVDHALDGPNPSQILSRLSPIMSPGTRFALLGGSGSLVGFSTRLPWPTGPGALSHALRQLWVAASGASEKRERERRELAAEVELRHVRLPRQNLFERLDLQPGAGTDAVTRSHDRLTMRLHPDRIRELLPENLWQMALDVHLSIGEAYRSLRDPVRRRIHEAEISDDRDH